MIAALAVISTLVTLMGAAIGKLWAEHNKLSEARLHCEKAQAILQTKLTTVEAELRTVRDEMGRLRNTVAESTEETGAWLVCDLDGRILDAGGRVAHIFHRRPTSLIGCQVHDLLPDDPELLQAHERGLARVRSGDVVRAEAIKGRIKRPGGDLVDVVVALRIAKHKGERSIKAELFELAVEVQS